MGIVQKLPESLITRIAAGEVVERPASVLKELLENALDAGARAIDIEWKDAGQSLLRVTDDGCGMAPEDARRSLERHATSKIKNADDLEKIATFGFRGEALPSIACVSRFEMITRPPAAPEAWQIRNQGGRFQESPAGAPAGTSIRVADLFFNTPARLKFLKTETTERSHLVRTFEDVALSAVGTRFHVISEGRDYITLNAATASQTFHDILADRISTLWSLPTPVLKPVELKGAFLAVRGWVSDVNNPQSSQRYQRLFINGRPVVNRRLNHAIYEAYRGRLFVGKHPVAILFLEMDPSLVDVNVHPSKREVRMSHENEIYGFVLRAVQESLAGGVQVSKVLPQEKRPQNGPATPFARPAISALPSFLESRASFRIQAPASSVATSSTPSATLALPTEESLLSLEEFRAAKPQILMQLDGTYIVTRLEQDVLIFDQHAAAERALYEKLRKSHDEKVLDKQGLLIPWVWEMPAHLAVIAKNHVADFQKLGFGVEIFGDKTLRVLAVPSALEDTAKARALLQGLVEDLADEVITKNWEALLVRAACRGSVKAHDYLKTAEMAKIIFDLKQCDSPWTCPHGRPTFLKLSPQDLAKRFKRT